MEKIGSLFVMFMKLLPAVVIFALFFSFDGYLRWLCLLGIIPLVLAFNKGCTACMAEPDTESPEQGWKHGTGH